MIVLPSSIAVTLYINNTNAACDNDYTYVQAQAPATPWCDICTKTVNQTADGDTLCIAPGTYWANETYLYHKNFTSQTTITKCGEGIVWLHFIQGAKLQNFSVNNTNWTLIKDDGTYRYFRGMILSYGGTGIHISGYIATWAEWIMTDDITSSSQLASTTYMTTGVNYNHTGDRQSDNYKYRKY